MAKSIEPFYGRRGPDGFWMRMPPPNPIKRRAMMTAIKQAQPDVFVTPVDLEKLVRLDDNGDPVRKDHVDNHGNVIHRGFDYVCAVDLVVGGTDKGAWNGLLRYIDELAADGETEIPLRKEIKKAGRQGRYVVTKSVKLVLGKVTKLPWDHGMYVLNPEKWGGIVREVDPEEYGLDQPVKVGAPVNTFEPVDTVSVEPEPEQEDDTVHPDAVLRNPKATKQMLLDALDQLNPRHGLDKRYNRENIRSRLSQALGYGPDADNVPPRPLPASGSEE